MALLCSLLACLGSDITSQSGHSTSVKTELALATSLTVKQAQPVQERQRSSTLYSQSRSSWFTALTMYNEWIIRQLKLVKRTTFTFTCFTRFLPVKTIPASTDGLFSSPSRG